MIEGVSCAKRNAVRFIVRILGMPPEPSHSLWRKQGITITDHARLLDESALQDRIQAIGMSDCESSVYDGKFGVLESPYITGVVWKEDY